MYTGNVLHLCVILFTGGLCPGAVSVQGVFVQGGVCQGDPSVRWRAGSKHPTGMHSCIAVLLDVFDIVWIIRFREIFTSQKCCITFNTFCVVHAKIVRAPVCLFTGPGVKLSLTPPPVMVRPGGVNHNAFIVMVRLGRGLIVTINALWLTPPCCG